MSYRLGALLVLLLAGAWVPSAAATYEWSTGDFPSDPAVPNPLADGDTLMIVSGGAKRFFGGSFVNLGRVEWLQDDLAGSNGASVANANLWISSADTSISGSGTLPTFTNTGTLRKSQGKGATTFANWRFVNDAGTVEALSGSIVFSGGPTTFNAGSRMQGAGRIELATNAAFNGDFFADNLVLGSGVFTGTDARLAGGAALPGGRIAWMGGDIAGTWEIGSGGVVTASGAGAKRHTGGTLLNRGTVLWQSETGLQGGGGASFVNEGLYEAQANTSIGTFNPGARNSFVNRAAGVVRAADGVTLTIDGVALSSAGGEFNAAGATSSIRYVGGFARFEDGTRFTGAGTHVVNNDARFIGTFHATNLQFGGGTQSGGDGVTADSKAVLQGTLAWTGGNLQGAWQILPGSTVTATGLGAKQQTGGSIVNDGSFVWDAQPDFRGGGGATFVNNALFEARTTSGVAFSGSGNRNAFTNGPDGIVRATDGATLTFGNVALTSNGGQFDAKAGSAIVYAGLPNVFGDGTRFTGEGTHTIQGDARFVGTIDAANLAFGAGGMRTGGDPAVAGSKAVLRGTVQWAGGDLQGTWELASHTTLTATGSGARALAGGSLRNDGLLVWKSDASLQIAQGATVRNDGVFEVTTDADIVHSVGMPGSFLNNGRFVKSGGAGVTAFSGVTLENTGTIEVQSGTVQLPSGFHNQGVLSGSGSFAVSGFLVNEGRIAPGSSPGTLTVQGNFRQEAGGVLQIEVESASAYDHLIVTGTAMLGGTLEIVCFADCRMAVDETITVLSFGSTVGNGAFDAITMTGFRTGNFEPIYEPDGLRLRVTQALAPVPEPQTYVLMLAGIGLVGWALRRTQRRHKKGSGSIFQ